VGERRRRGKRRRRKAAMVALEVASTQPIKPTQPNSGKGKP